MGIKIVKDYGNYFIDEIERTGKIIYEKASWCMDKVCWYWFDGSMPTNEQVNLFYEFAKKVEKTIKEKLNRNSLEW